MKLALIIFVLVIAFSSDAYAIAPGDSCTTAGQTATGNSSNGAINLMSCNGSTWVAIAPRIGDSVATCASGVTGTLRYNSGALSVCDGTTWRGLSQNGTSTTPGVPGEGGTGYFVMSSTTHDANFGGIGGANAFCRSDLSSNSWMGKPGTLDTSKVFAFLQTPSLMQMPTPNSTFYYAVSGSPTVGGASFQTNNLGQGPGDNIAWSASNRFGANYTYWTGFWYCQTSTYWGICSEISYSCQSWTDTSTGQAIAGGSGYTDAQRFFVGAPVCGSPNYLICFVNP